MKKVWDQFAFKINRAYRSLLDISNQEKIVWKELKKLHSDCGWHTGVYEEDKFLETVFSIADETPGYYHYSIRDNELQCTVRVLENYGSELTTDVFVLASHFNNLLKFGVVEVNVDSSAVTYRLPQNALVPCLYTGEIYNQITMHYETSKDIYWAFQKLNIENEEPTLIIADLLRIRDERKRQAEESQS